MDHLPVALAVTIFVATYAIVALGKIPVYRIDRAGAALLGGALMVGTGVLSLDEAYRAVNFGTITLLLGMMIVVANLRVSGFFRVVNYWIATRMRHPFALLAAVTLATAFLSAFLVNDAICLVMTPLVLDVVARLKRNPIPYLLAIAMASNIGSLATITGNPQNIIIGSLSHVPYVTFAARLTPVAVFGIAMTLVLIALAYRREFFGGETLPAVTEPPPHYHQALVIKNVLVIAAIVGLFFVGAPPAEVAIVGGAFLLLTRRVRPEKIYREIDWPLLVMFVGLFVVVRGLEKTVIAPNLDALAGGLHLTDGWVLGGVTAVLSNIVSNVPAVLLLKPFVPNLPDPQQAWLVVAMAATLAGNFTLVGSIANLIVAERAKAEGVTLDFGSYFMIGAPLTVITIIAGLLWLGG